MNFKIIILPETQTEVCLHRECNDENEEIVRITTFVRGQTWEVDHDSKVYIINSTNGAATEACTLNVPLDLTGDPAFGIDFTPYNNRLVVTSSAGQLSDVNVGNGPVRTFSPFTSNGVPKSMDGLAYIDSHLGQLNADAPLYG